MLETLFPPRHGSVYLIGGGGKTTLMYRLADELEGRGEKVVTTTSTRILDPSGATSAHVLVRSNMERLIEELRASDHARVTVAKRRDRDESPDKLHRGPAKLLGYSAEELDRLQSARVATALIVEADGASGRPLKAHADHEPVVSPRAGVVVAVVGVDCVGRPLDERWVHRPRLFAERLSIPLGTTIRPEHVAGILVHPAGYLAKVSADSRVVLAITKVSSTETLAAARSIATALRSLDRDGRVRGMITIDPAGVATAL